MTVATEHDLRERRADLLQLLCQAADEIKQIDGRLQALVSLKAQEPGEP